MTATEQGPAVQAVQQALIDLGFDIPSGATGFFGQETSAAVVAFKTMRVLDPADAVVGSGTMAALDAAFLFEDPARAGGILPEFPQLRGPGTDDRIPGELVLILTPSAHATVTTLVPTGPLGTADNPPMSLGVSDIDIVLAGLNVTGITRVFGDVAPVPGVDPEVNEGLTATYKVRCDPNTDLDQALAALQSASSVIEASADTYVWPTTFPANDEKYWTQHGLWRTRAPQAWLDGQVGSPGITVAVVDTGVDLVHPDLAARLVLGIDLFDPPPFKYTDDFYVTGRAGKPGVTTPMDDVGHGTVVAGVIGAVTNNHLGIAGVTWATAIMPVRAIGRAMQLDGNRPTGVAGATSLCHGIIASASFGARVINVSAGGYGALAKWEDFALKQARALGALCVAAFGNDDKLVAQDFPASHPSVLGVGGIFSYGARWVEDVPGPNGPEHVGSNKGSQLGIMAPAANIISTKLQSGPHASSEKFKESTGNSMAAPFVSGVAALLLAEKPAATPDQITSVLLNSADAPPNAASAGVPNDEYGHGLLNARKALAIARQTL